MGKRILICDDEMDILEMVTMMLEFQGFNVTTQQNSAKLIDQAILEKPDLLLVDLWMPFLSGEELIRCIRSSADLKYLPIILFSAAPQGNSIAKDAGANAFIAKPFDMNEMVEMIQCTMSA